MTKSIATDFTPTTRVKHEDGRAGTVCPDLPGMLSCNGPGEISVVYDGTVVVVGTLETSLSVLGPEGAAPNPHKCGAGLGAECCIFLTVGAKGFECERHTGLRLQLVFKDMVAKRSPAEPYPDCMIHADKIT